MVLKSVLVSEQMQESVSATLVELQALRPVLAECGFLIGDIEITLSLPPSFKIEVMRSNQAVRSLTEIDRAIALSQIQRIFIGQIDIAADAPANVKICLQ